MCALKNVFDISKSTDIETLATHRASVYFFECNAPT